MIKILHCPFCGGMLKTKQNEWGRYRFTHTCKGNADGVRITINGKWFDTLEDAISAWNRREMNADI